MTAKEVKEALYRRWPATEYVLIEEAPEHADRGGRRVDVLVLSCWKSRGYEIQGVEVKVSLGDWRRELDNGRKADFWWLHCHRFWVAVPEHLVDGIVPTLPPGWGLLSVDADGKAHVAAEGARREAEALSWPTVVGLLRAIRGTGAAAIDRARQEGERAGVEAGRQEAEALLGEAACRRDLEALTARVEAFKDVTGVDLLSAWNVDEAVKLGEVFAIAARALRSSDAVAREFASISGRMRKLADEFEEVAMAAEDAMRADRLSDSPPP